MELLLFKIELIHFTSPSPSLLWLFDACLKSADCADKKLENKKSINNKIKLLIPLFVLRALEYVSLSSSFEKSSLKLLSPLLSKTKSLYLKKFKKLNNVNLFIMFKVLINLF